MSKTTNKFSPEVRAQAGSDRKRHKRSGKYLPNRMGSDRLHARFRDVSKRLSKLEVYWNNEDYFNQVVASGRYLKLVDATAKVQELIDELQHQWSIALENFHYHIITD